MLVREGSLIQAQLTRRYGIVLTVFVDEIFEAPSLCADVFMCDGDVERLHLREDYYLVIVP